MRILVFLLLIQLLPSQLLAQNIHISANFNDTLVPTGWTTTLSNANNSWQVGIDGTSGPASFSSGIQNIDGTAFAFFDDDVLGSSSIDSVAAIETSAFDNSNDPVTLLDFDYNFKEFLGIADSFFVDVFDGSNWNRVFSRSNDDCGHYMLASCANGFPHAQIDISAYKNSNCRVRFSYYDGEDWGWYAGIDNVEIWSPLDKDLSITYIEPSSLSCSSSDSLSVVVKNSGSLIQGNFQLGYILNNGNPVTATYTDSLTSQETDTFTFPNLINYQAGNNQLKVFSALIADQNLQNDTLSTIATGAGNYTLPYFEDFEGNNIDWTSNGTNSSWQIGIPNNSIIDTAAAGTKAAVSNLSGDYNASELSYLNTPCILLGSLTSAIRISFDLTYIIETAFDRAWMEYSTDGGITFSKLINNSSYSSLNWYASNSFWSGSDSNWTETSVTMDNLIPNSTIRFRFVLSSDGSTQFEGVGVDNFQVTDLDSTDLAVKRVSYPTNNLLCGLGEEPIVIEIENNGIDSIGASKLYYQINGGLIYVDSLQQALLPGSNRVFTFSQPYNFTNLSLIDLKVWASTPRDSLFSNDTLNIQLTNSSANNLSVPFAQNFDSMIVAGSLGQGWTRNLNPPYTWLVANNGTASNNTGPDQDATGGNFVFLETSSTFTIDPVIESPCIQLGTDSGLLLSFAYHMYGSSMGTLYLDIYDAGQWVLVDRIIGQQQTSGSDPWRYREISLDQYLGRSIKFRFRGRETGGNSFRSDMAIDDVRIDTFGVIPLTNISEFTIDSSRCPQSGNAQISLRVLKKDSSFIDKDSLSFELFMNGVALTTEYFSRDLGSSLVDTVFTFSLRPNINFSGDIQFKVISNLFYNGDIIRDSLSKDIVYKINQFPYYQGFENLYEFCYDGIGGIPELFNESEGWHLDDLASPKWIVLDSNFCSPYHLPSRGPSFPYQGSSFIYLDRPSPTTVGDTSFLQTPCFDLPNSLNLQLEYSVARYTSVAWAIGDLILEIDSMGTWVEIDRIDTVIANPQSPWIRSTIDLSSYSGMLIKFRFYGVDVNLTTPSRSGTALDAFRIFDPLATNIESQHTFSNSPSLSIFPNPNQGSFRIDLPNQLLGETYEIIDLSGKTLKRANFKGNREVIDLNAEKGVYILRVPAKGIREKIVVY